MCHSKLKIQKLGFIDPYSNPNYILFRFKFDSIYYATSFMWYIEDVYSEFHISDDGLCWYVDVWCSKDYAELIVDDFLYEFTPAEIDDDMTYDEWEMECDCFE